MTKLDIRAKLIFESSIVLPSKHLIELLELAKETIQLKHEVVKTRTVNDLLIGENERLKKALEELRACDGYGDPGHMLMTTDCCEIDSAYREAQPKEQK